MGKQFNIILDEQFRQKLEAASSQVGCSMAAYLRIAAVEKMRREEEE